MRLRKADFDGSHGQIHARIAEAQSDAGKPPLICLHQSPKSGLEFDTFMREASRDRMAFTRREPIGVVVAISAFNHPLNLIVHQVVSAIGVGCPVIVKPSEETPLSCLLFVQMLRRAGLPDSWAQVLISGVIHEARIGQRTAPCSSAERALHTRICGDGRRGAFPTSLSQQRGAGKANAP